MDVQSELNLYEHVNFLAETSKQNNKSKTIKDDNFQNKTALNVRPKRKKKSKSKQKQKLEPQQRLQKQQQQLHQNPKPHSKQIQNFQKNAGAKKNFNKFQKPYQRKSTENPLKNRRQPQFELNADELLFFPKNYDPRPDTKDAKYRCDLVSKNNYLARVRGMSDEKQRNLRSQQDVRYLNKPRPPPPDAEADEEIPFCFDHLVGRCNAQMNCGRWHQIRPPRFMGVCKFFLSGCCANVDSCQYMHEEFPCRFYYLNIDHPKAMEEEKCRFKHGGPLPKRLYYYFKKQIGLWVKELIKDKQKDYEKELENYINKFETKHAKLEQEYGVESNESSMELSEDDKFSIKSILSSKQLKALTEMNITTAAQINQIPIDDLIDIGLTMDQIYTITTNACNESDQSHVMCEDLKETNGNDDVLTTNTMELGRSADLVDSETNAFDGVADVSNSSTNVDSKDIQSLEELNEVSLHGFSQIELIEAEEILQAKRHIFLGVKIPTNAYSNSEQTNTTDQLVTLFDAKSEANETQMVNKESNEDNSDNSDNEFNLIINEDI